MTEHIKKKLADEIAVLERELNHELPKALKLAIAMGDLSENAEYHMAKQRQEIVRARLGQLKKRMGDLSLINMNNIPRDRASIGSTVKVYDSSKDEEIEYKLVTSEEADIAKGMISTSSPIGKALMGKKEGDTVTVVTPTGNREMDVLKLTTIHEIEESEAAQ
jgi:transcription elongation factor GreA